MKNIVNSIKFDQRNIICEVPEGVDAAVLAALRSEAAGRDLLVVLRDAERVRRMSDALAFFDPDGEVRSFPAWDCVPYDRVSPHSSVAGERLSLLGDLGERRAAGSGAGLLVLTTARALLQRVPPGDVWAALRMRLRCGSAVDPADFGARLAAMGYVRAGTVMEPGDFSIRGDIADIFPPGVAEPVRLDFFGDTVERIRTFDPLSQRSTGTRDGIVIDPASEVLLDADSIARFRDNWRALFGVSSVDDPVYEAVSAGLRHPGMEHWLPLFHERLEPFSACLGDGPLFVLDHQVLDARDAHLETIGDHYLHRQEADSSGSTPVYHAVEPGRLYLDGRAWEAMLAEHTRIELSPLSEPPVDGVPILRAGGQQGRDFGAERRRGHAGLFDTVAEHVTGQQAAGRRVVIAGLGPNSSDRLAGLLEDHGVERIERLPSGDWSALPRQAVAVTVLNLDRGFVTADLAVITEQDILGDRITGSPPRRRRRRDTERFLLEAAQLSDGDHVVHIDHGIGRFDGLQTLDLGGAPHDCLRLVYAGGDTLFVPVENIDTLSRYGSHDAVVQLDRLGSAAWQARHARLQKRMLEMAGDLLRIASERMMQSGPSMQVDRTRYQEFCAGFPFQETDDQDKAIEDVLDDLRSDRAMDRLVCGDVGFGKTEVAMRAAFVAVMNGFQVAVIAPTTLLVRQHYATFTERFAALPVNIARLSRMVAAGEARETRDGMEKGGIDIVIGTHALLSRTIGFRNLGLLVIDEEQHFGVVHKERLKQMKANVHVLTLTATPIPRTLQMALTGVRDLSLIATAPVDRLAIRTFLGPFDSVTVREAIRRERLRGGQTYVVCPRIADLQRLCGQLEELVPDARFAVAHGRMARDDLEHVMAAFYDGEIDVLVSTAIVESGLDIPNVNTLIVHRADRFGLAQLYQLRGRIGRSKHRAYAYLTLPPGRKPARTAMRRLLVLSQLDTLGAGFSLASRDLDMRGAGNLLGSEQSGHIREIGIELYQQMLEEAVHKLRAEQEGTASRETASRSWSPEVAVGSAVLIPDDYVRDLDVRLGLYRRIAALEDHRDTDELRTELNDRFGDVPPEVDNLLEIVAIKASCRRAGIARFDAGPRGAVLSFRDNSFANPAGLVDWIAGEAGAARLRPDHRVVVVRDWDRVDVRLAGSRDLAERFAEIAEGAGVP